MTDVGKTGGSLKSPCGRSSRIVLFEYSLPVPTINREPQKAGVARVESNIEVLMVCTHAPDFKYLVRIDCKAATVQCGIEPQSKAHTGVSMR